MSKWRWMPVKQIGARPTARSGISCAGIPNTNKVFFFGGVQDNENIDDEDSDSDDEGGDFFNDLYSVNVENERATWTKIELSGKKDLTRKPKEKSAEVEATEEAIEEMQINDKEGVTKVVEEGAFTISSTIGIEAKEKSGEPSKSKVDKAFEKLFDKGPSPRFGAQMTIRQGTLYLFGGMVEDSSDRQLTHKDLYSLDIHKLDEWEVIIEDDIKPLEESDDDSEDDSEDEDDSEEDGMDTS